MGAHLDGTFSWTCSNQLTISTTRSPANWGATCRTLRKRSPSTPNAPTEPRDAVRIVRDLRRQHLDRDVPAETVVVRPIHLSHAAAAQTRNDPVEPDLLHMGCIPQGSRSLEVGPCGRASSSTALTH